MDTECTCYLCDKPAEIVTIKGEGNQRLSVSCEADCPRYVITRRAIRELERNPGRKPYIMKNIRTIVEERPADVPVIRMGKESKELMVKPHSEEDEYEG
jgi:hypothetical protein